MKNHIFVLLPILYLTMPVHAQDRQTTTTGFREEFIYQVIDVEKKIVALAGAIPQEKFTWRPAEGVRSISEVYLHTVGSNYYVMEVVGIKPPSDVNMSGGENSLEKSTTDKAKIAEILKRSFEHIRQGVEAISDADLERQVKLFGRTTSVRDALMTLALHQHEHLGQSIAYARMSGVVPPWTAERMAREKKN